MSVIEVVTHKRIDLVVKTASNSVGKRASLIQEHIKNLHITNLFAVAKTWELRINSSCAKVLHIMQNQRELHLNRKSEITDLCYVYRYLPSFTSTIRKRMAE